MADMEWFLGYRVFCADVNEVWREALGGRRSGRGARLIFCLNPHSAVVAARSPRFRAALSSADYLVADGAGMCLAAAVTGTPLRRITGSDVFESACEWSVGKDVKHFFLGSKPATVTRLIQAVEKRYPGIRVVGSYSPPFVPAFSPEDSRAMVEAVNVAAPDVLWVGMTAPKQEEWVYQHRGELHAKCIAGIGAVFDYVAGTVRRPGPWWRACGLEWCARLAREPRRLWRRTFLSGPQFAWLVVTDGRGSREGRWKVARHT